MINNKGFIIGVLIGWALALAGTLLYESTHRKSSMESEVIVQEVIKSGVVKRAKQFEEKSNEIELRARKVGIICAHSDEMFQDCEKLTMRVEKNPQLKELFLSAKNIGVLIFASTGESSSVGEVSDGYISIYTSHTDEEIIAFLMEE